MKITEELIKKYINKRVKITLEDNYKVSGILMECGIKDKYKLLVLEDGIWETWFLKLSHIKKIKR